MTHRDGFSLIEALVALIISAFLLLSVFGVHRTLVDAQLRSERALSVAEAQRNALAYLEDLNPSLNPQGELVMAGGATLRWRATPLGEARPNLLPNGLTGRFDVQLFQIDVAIEAAQGRTLSELSFQRMGWSETFSGASYAE